VRNPGGCREWVALSLTELLSQGIYSLLPQVVKYMREVGRVNLECPFKNGDKGQLSKIENRGNAAQESPESIGSGTARESAARAVRKSNK